MQLIVEYKTKVRFIVIVISLLFSPKLMSQEVDLKLNYYGEVDRKLNIIMLGANDEFKNVFKDNDKQLLFDHEYQPSDLADADYVAIFLLDWSDASALPDSLDFIKPNILNMNKGQVNLFKVYTIKDNQTNEIRRLIFSVYNLNKLQGKEYYCFAKDIIGGLTLTNEDYKKNNIGTCK